MRCGAAAFLFVMLFSPPGFAQSPSSDDPRDVIPDKTPFDVPYGPSITLGQAQNVISAAMAVAQKHDWKISFAVSDSGGNVVAIARMDGAQLSSAGIAEHKSRAAVLFRRPTAFYETGIHNNQLYQLSIDDVIASRGGIPLIQDGKIIGAIGAAGGAGSQDQMCAEAGVKALVQKGP